MSKDQKTTETSSHAPLAGVVKSWRDSDFDCPECGDMALTDSTAPENYYYDGDCLKCPECGREGWVSVDGDEDEPRVWDSWD